MIKVGEMVKWRCPLDEDYSYGTVLKIKDNLATVLGSGYYTGVITEVHLRSIEKLGKGGNKVGGNKKYLK